MEISLRRRHAPTVGHGAFVIDSFCACVSLDSEHSLSSSLLQVLAFVSALSLALLSISGSFLVVTTQFISQLFLGYTVPVSDSIVSIIQDDRPPAFLQALLDPESHFKDFLAIQNKSSGLIRKNVHLICSFFPYLFHFVWYIKNLAGHHFDINCGDRPFCGICSWGLTQLGTP